MKPILKPLLLIAGAGLFLTSCGTTVIVSTPIENIDNVPLKIEALTDAQKQNWGHMDLVQDTVPGMSVDKAYAELLEGRKGKTVIVAVIDAGIDIDHEDLEGVIWTNKKEVPNNGKDDDRNGYADDFHGWNFLGKSYNETLEMTRIVKAGDSNSTSYQSAKAQLDKEYQETLAGKTRYDRLLQQTKSADEAVKAKLGKSEYTKEDLEAIENPDEAMKQHIGFLTQMLNYADSIPDLQEQLEGGVEYFGDRLNYNLNVDFDGRKVVGDDAYDINDKNYGDNNVKPVKKSESHGTHVAGIIAAKRNNGKGANGVANNVLIMPVRAVPNGDEYDKDVALAIRYAADNGAKIINTSFGKGYSPNSKWVRDAIAYAGKKDVLIVNAAGNDGKDLDDPNNPTFPNDAVNNGPEVSDNFLTVGALANKYGSNMVAGFSNYGKINVDVFAPGAGIYSTMPENEYKFQGGTSMAAPAVAGVAALIRSYFPKLKASQVKEVIMRSGLPVAAKVVVGGDPKNVKPFGDLSKSAKMVNAYNALILASKTK